MCGICGVVGDLGMNSSNWTAVRPMADVLSHRGPDDQGYYSAEHVALGFRRLSIVDLSGGHQPMCNEDGTIWIVFNGEIYNHGELREELDRHGHRYRTRSDTETIIHAYEEYGDDCVHHLRGMFAFAIWDGRRKRLFCARDRLGIKPLYYAALGDRFAFASEIKALLRLPGISARISRAALPEFFALGYLSSEETLFEGIRKLLPGNRLTVEVVQGKLQQPSVEPYWDLHLSEDNSLASESDCIARFTELFRESVKLRLMSDVPLGVFLSGGIDSSSIAAVMADLVRGPVETFSVGYNEQQFSELPSARIVAKHIGSRHNEVILTCEDFLQALPQLIWHEDEPLVWPSSVALHAVSQLAREKVKVVLTGEGADELLGGYLKYRVTLWNLRYGWLYRRITPSAIRDVVAEALNSSYLPMSVRRKLRHTFLYYPGEMEKIYFDNFYSVFPAAEQKSLFTRSLTEEVADINPYARSLDYYQPNGRPVSTLNRLLYLDIKTYLVELLMKQDQMSMAASIESRVPFLDHKLVEFVMRIPARHKLRLQSAKYLLRRAMAGRLPAGIVHRTKKGFPTPLRLWIRRDFFERINNVLMDGRLAERGLLNPNYVRHLLDAHRIGRMDATDRIWKLLNFELWNRIFIDGEVTAPQFAPRADRVSMKGAG